MDEEDHMVIKSIDTDGTIIVEVCLLSITANVTTDFQQNMHSVPV
jgi:hypothetical protein